MPRTKHLGSGRDGSGWETKVGVTLELPRGADNYYEFEHGHLASEIKAAIFTARKKDNSEPGTGTVVIQLSLVAHPTQWDLDTNWEGKVIFTDANSDLLRKASNEMDLDYDIEFTLNDDDIVPVEVGDLLVLHTVTEDDGTAQYLTNPTRATLEAEVTAILAGLKSSALGAAAVSGATDILVLTGHPFVVGDTINIVNDTDYDQRAITSISTNTLSFSGGISNAASIGNSVFKVI